MAVEINERFADDEVGDKERNDWRQQIEALRPPVREDLLRASTAVGRLFANWFSRQHADATAQDIQEALAEEAERLAFCQGHPRWEAEGAGKSVAQAEAMHQADLLRDLINRPPRQFAIDPRWRSTVVLQILKGIHEDHAFDRLPILADALEEAGCDQAEILDHFRRPRPHSRGCWVIDQLMHG